MSVALWFTVIFEKEPNPGKIKNIVNKYFPVIKKVKYFMDDRPHPFECKDKWLFFVEGKELRIWKDKTGPERNWIMKTCKVLLTLLDELIGIEGKNIKHAEVLEEAPVSEEEIRDSFRYLEYSNDPKTLLGLTKDVTKEKIKQVLIESLKSYFQVFETENGLGYVVNSLIYLPVYKVTKPIVRKKL